MIIGFEGSTPRADAVPAEEALDMFGALKPGYSWYLQEVTGGDNLKKDSSYFYKTKRSSAGPEVGV